MDISSNGGDIFPLKKKKLFQKIIFYISFTYPTFFRGWEGTRSAQSNNISSQTFSTDRYRISER